MQLSYVKRKIEKDQKRAELLRRLSDLGRKISTQTVFLHQAIAQGIGLNATDTKCLDLIGSEPDGTITAGRLSDLTGLTTGPSPTSWTGSKSEDLWSVCAIPRTGAECSFAYGPAAGTIAAEYEAIGKAYMALAGQYSDDDLSLICGYMDQASELTERLMTDVIAAAGRRRLRPLAVCKLRPPVRSPGQTVDPVNQDLHDIGDVARAGDQRHRAGGFGGLGSTKKSPSRLVRMRARNDGAVLWWRQRDHARLFGARWRHHRFPCPRGRKPLWSFRRALWRIAREVRRDP